MGPGNAPASSVSAATVWGPTASGAVPPPVSVASTPRPAALKSSAGALGGAPCVAAGADHGGAAAALDAAMTAARTAPGAARTTSGGRMEVPTEKGGMTLRQRASLCRQAELLDDLVPVAAPERQDLAAAEAADDRDAGVGRAPARRRDEAQEADDRAVDLVGGLDLRVEPVPELLDLLEPAAHAAVALVAGALVEQAEHRLRLDVRADLGEHAPEVTGRPGRVETPDRVDFRLSHAASQSCT